MSVWSLKIYVHLEIYINTHTYIYIYTIEHLVVVVVVIIITVTVTIISDITNCVCTYDLLELKYPKMTFIFYNKTNIPSNPTPCHPNDYDDDDEDEDVQSH